MDYRHRGQHCPGVTNMASLTNAQIALLAAALQNTETIETKRDADIYLDWLKSHKKKS